MPKEPRNTFPDEPAITFLDYPGSQGPGYRISFPNGCGVTIYPEAERYEASINEIIPTMIVNIGRDGVCLATVTVSEVKVTTNNLTDP